MRLLKWIYTKFAKCMRTPRPMWYVLIIISNEMKSYKVLFKIFNRVFFTDVLPVCFGLQCDCPPGYVKNIFNVCTLVPVPVPVSLALVTTSK